MAKNRMDKYPVIAHTMEYYIKDEWAEEYNLNSWMKFSNKRKRKLNTREHILCEKEAKLTCGVRY